MNLIQAKQIHQLIYIYYKLIVQPLEWQVFSRHHKTNHSQWKYTYNNRLRTIAYFTISYKTLNKPNILPIKGLDPLYKQQSKVSITNSKNKANVVVYNKNFIIQNKFKVI